MEEREYYGNTGDYLVYFVDLNELYNFLTEGMEEKKWNLKRLNYLT
jgi:hypothetical protein